MIETLTYSFQDAEQLATVNSKLEEIFSNMKTNMPQSDGLVIRPMIAKRAKQISQKYRSQLAVINSKYSTLPPEKKRGRRKQSASFRNRVGIKAQRLRKVPNYYYNIILKIDPTDTKINIGWHYKCRSK